MNEEICDVYYVDEKKVKKVEREMLESEKVDNIVDIFKAIGDQTRLKILYALSKEEMCVCDISALLKMRDSAISHHLKLLRTLRLVKFKRKGKMAYYSLNDDHVIKLLEIGVEHAEE
ncbi:MAG: ArsR/SmtB family transcription factor [Methanosarcinales archaeon]